VSTPQALDGIRVVDFTTGPAGGLATTVLADFGADVIKVEPLAGDRFRSLPGSAVWLRGKRSVVLDLKTASGQAQAKELATSADVVVVAGAPSRLLAHRLDSATLQTDAPHLIHCTISGWGQRGPYAELAGYEGLVAAKSGRMASFEVQLGTGRPVFAAVPVATHLASQSAVHGIVAALIDRQRTGVGAIVETSLLQCLFPFDLTDLLALQLADRRDQRYEPLRTLSTMPTLNYHPVRTQDGHWIQCGNLLEHLLFSFLDSIDLLGELLVDERFQSSPADWTPQAIEVARDMILNRCLERPAADWMATFRENGNVAAEIVVNGDQAMHHRDLVNGGALVQLSDARHGSVTQIGPIADLGATPGVVTTGAPNIGEHQDQLATWLGDSRPSVPPPVTRSSTPGQPLDGITVIDLSAIIAGPLAGSMLADLGARVIKVEPFGGDPFRQLLTEGRMAVKMNAGKESICIDLKQPKGHQLLHELIAATDANVIMHNFRGDVPDRLGLGYEQVRAIKPDIIWAVVNGYGPDGPSAKRPATHPVVGAASGGVAYQAGPALTADCPTLADVREHARQIMAANDANPDPNTSVVAASAILLALVAQQRQGIGQVVRINMQVANAWANIDDFVDWPTKPARSPVDPDHRGLHAGYRLYPARSGWIFLAATTAAEFERFAAVIGRPELRLDSSDLANTLAAVFAAEDADAWEERMTAAQVGCVQADGIDVGTFLRDDAHVLHNGWAPMVEHERFGTVKRWGPTVTVGGLNPDYRSAPLAGEHTDALLAELGHTDAAIAKLRTDRIVNSEAAPVPPT